MAMYSRAIMRKISSQHIKLINDFFLYLQRRNDRETIRRRLAMGEEDDYLARPMRKPNLQSRMQSGK